MMTSRESDPYREPDTSLVTNSPLQQRALVIGINRYDPPVRALSNAVNDASAIAKILTEEYGFMVTSLLDKEANLVNIQNAIAESLHSESDVRWLFYFAGHGTVIADNGYLLPTNAEKGKPESMISLPGLLRDCIKSPCGEVLLILDSCYSGRGFVRLDSLDLPTPSTTERRVRQIITSGNPIEPVLDVGADGHSIFTQTLLEILQGWTGAHNEQGEISFSKLRDELAYQIPVRLRAQERTTLLQQPLGGNFQGNSLGREFSFFPVSSIHRLPPENVRDLRSGDSERRVAGLQRLIDIIDVETRQQVVQMALYALQKDSSVTVRAAAATVLGRSDDLTAVSALIAALNDAVSVCLAAAESLGLLKDQRAAMPLLARLQNADDELFLGLVDAIGAVGEPSVIIATLCKALEFGKLVPFIGPDLQQRLTGVQSRADFTTQFAIAHNLPPTLPISLAQVAEVQTKGRFVHELWGALKAAYRNNQIQPGEFYTMLSRLHIPFWLSACYDDFLVSAINKVNSIVTGSDTQYLFEDRPSVVHILGDLDRSKLVVLEHEYELLRESEIDRKLLLRFLRQELKGKIVLFLGFDPTSPDFALLGKYILNGHLAGLDVCTFLVWQPAIPSSVAWNGYLMHRINLEPVEFVKSLLEK